jgi:citrate lyase beta subunit
MDGQSPWIRAEVLIFDLENTVPAPDKVAARALVREALER